MEELNQMLLEKCRSYLSHQIRGKEASVGAMLAQEKVCLYPLPGYPFDTCKRSVGRVDRFCTVRFDTNNYPVPAAYCGKEVSVKAGPETVSIYYEGQCVAQHRRCLERKQNIYTLEHYLPLLDGNGRTGRLLVNLELMKAGYPPIDIKFTDRLAYYNAFVEYHVKHNLSAMEKLFAGYINERLDMYWAMLQEM